jgi:hypothetical protein
MWVIAVQSSKIVVSEENQSPNIFHLNFYINGDMNDIYSLGIDYAPFKMAYVSSLLEPNKIFSLNLSTITTSL